MEDYLGHLSLEYDSLWDTKPSCKNKVNPSEDLPTASSIKEDEVETSSGFNEEKHVSDDSEAITDAFKCKDKLGEYCADYKKQDPLYSGSEAKSGHRESSLLGVRQEKYLHKNYGYKSMKLARDSVQPPKLKLRFINSPPPVMFTDSKIMAEDGKTIPIELVDTNTNTRVHTSDSFPLLEIVPMSAGIREESWTSEEFNRNILRPRKGKQPLLNGEMIMILKDGFRMISANITFTDNSSWQRSKKFQIRC